MKQFKNFGIIISGQPRSGKSTLANIFSKIPNLMFLKLMCFYRHLKDNKPLKNYKDGVRNFLDSFRYQDSERKEKDM